MNKTGLVRRLLLQNKILHRVIQPGKYLKDVCVGFFVFLKHRTQTRSAESGKAVYLDIQNNVYTRYLYLLVKFFHLEGYTVYFKAHPVSLRYISHFRQSRLIIEEKIAQFTLKEVKGCQLYLSDTGSTQCLSADYFTNLMRGTVRDKDYYIPMAMHPNMYHNSWWNEPCSQGKKLKSVFFAGNIDRNHYTIKEEDNLFRVVDRVRMYDLLQTFNRLFVPNTLEELEERTQEQEVVIVEKERFLVPMQKLRPMLSRYAFFLACPGYIMPFSHNIVEAMSVGAIPIIQEKYARLFQPVLEHGKNAFFFKNEKDLLDQIRQALNLSDKTIAFLSENALAYYQEYLTPEKVVSSLIGREHKHVFLNAELPSVDLLRTASQQQHSDTVVDSLKKAVMALYGSS